MPHAVGSATHSAPVALSSEERLALENIYLGEGLSDSSVSEVLQTKKSKKVIVKKCGRLPTAPKNRDAMGNYIPPPGGKPLSSINADTPGPIYEPSYTQVEKQYPQFSLGGQDTKRPGHVPKNGNPGPNKYDTRGDMNWGCRRITLKAKIPRKYTTYGPGPTSAKATPYMSMGPKYSIPESTKRASVTFKNNPHVMPLARDSPGPAFKPSDDAWLEKPRSLGMKHVEGEMPAGPGPGKYNTDKKVKGTSYSIGIGRKDPPPSEGPGPGRYRLRHTVGKGPKAPISHKWSYHPENDTPGPDIYHRAGFRLDEPGYTMKYRWFDPEPQLTPGPADYRAVPPPKGPAFTIKHKVETAPSANPSPADYDPTSENWDKPGKSIGSRWRDVDKPACDCPYYPDPDLANKLLPSVPSYSFNKSGDKKKGPRTPGPSSYTPQLPKSKQTITMAKRIPRKLRISDSPGPAQALRQEVLEVEDPKCPKLVGGKAASLKSRHSPLKYTGQRNVGLLGPAPREIACASIII